jgi:predicted nucleic acid-binding protein
MTATYLDSSALMKLVVAEHESRALAEHLGASAEQVSAGLAHVEVIRAARRRAPDVVERARAVMRQVTTIALDETLLHAAADLDDGALRSLDAIHLAAASSLEDDLSELITYDSRMAAAARHLGLEVRQPA